MINTKKLLFFVGMNVVLVADSIGMGAVDMSVTTPLERDFWTTLGFEDVSSCSFQINIDREERKLKELKAQDSAIQLFLDQINKLPGVKGASDINKLRTVVSELVQKGEYVFVPSGLNWVKMYSDDGKTNKIKVVYSDINELSGLLLRFLCDFAKKSQKIYF